jgi:cytochrome c556
MAKQPSRSVVMMVTLCLSTLACQEPAATPDPPKAVVSIKEIMLSMVDPSADTLWESVSYTATPQGVIERAPKTDEDWAKVRAAAITLVETPNLLVMPGRAVAPKGEDIQDAKAFHGINSAVVRENLDREWAQFAMKARALQTVAIEAVAAVDARDPKALEVVGGRIDEACEACHTKFWYRPEHIAK